MFPEPIPTLLLKHNRFEMTFHVCIQHHIGKMDLRVPQIEKAVEVSTRPRKGDRDRRPRPAL